MKLKTSPTAASPKGDVRLPPLTSLLSSTGAPSSIGLRGSSQTSSESDASPLLPKRQQPSASNGSFRYDLEGGGALDRYRSEPSSSSQQPSGSSNMSSQQPSGSSNMSSLLPLRASRKLTFDASNSSSVKREARQVSHPDANSYHQNEEDHYQRKNKSPDRATPDDGHDRQTQAMKSDPLPPIRSLNVPQPKSTSSADNLHQESTPPVYRARYGAVVDQREPFTQPARQDLRNPLTQSFIGRPGSNLASVDGRRNEISHIFARLWQVLITARQYIEHPSSSSAAEFRSHDVRPPLPHVREGDFNSLFSHLQYELDHLHRFDPRTARELDFDAQNLQRQLDDLYRQTGTAEEGARSLLYNRHDQYPSSHAGPLVNAPHRYASYDENVRIVRRRPSDPFYIAHRTTLAEPGVGGESQDRRFAPFQPLYDGRSNDLGGTQPILYRDESGTYPSRPPIGYYGTSTPYSTHISVVDRYGRLVPMRGPLGEEGGPQLLYGQRPVAYVSTTAAPTPKRVRKRRDSIEQTCLSCSASETPEWRKGPTGPRTLCNACGLLFAKQCRKREMEQNNAAKQAHGGQAGSSSTAANRGRVGAGTTTADRMTTEERESSLLELQMAARSRGTHANQQLVPAPPQMVTPLASMRPIAPAPRQTQQNTDGEAEQTKSQSASVDGYQRG